MASSYKGAGRRASTSKFNGHTGVVNCTAADLDTTLYAILEEFSKECEDEVNEVVEETTLYTLAEVQSYIPPGAERYHNWKKYLKGWEIKTKYTLTTNNTMYTIWNKKQYMLTHLLEKGHVIAGTGKRTRKFPHISVAFQKGMEYMEKELRRRSAQ